jgi:hypothetical protein
MATKYFTPEFRADANYTIDMNHPEDDTLGGSTETFRSDEWQLEQISDRRRHPHRQRARALSLPVRRPVVGDHHAQRPQRGARQLGSLRRIQVCRRRLGRVSLEREARLNLDAGIFVSYIGLFSYYNFDNWTYQPSFVSSNTPWFFNGVRVQWFPTAKLKIEPWFINGWQTYARPNGKPGLGGQVLWRPSGGLNW